MQLRDESLLSESFTTLLFGLLRLPIDEFDLFGVFFEGVNALAFGVTLIDDTDSTAFLRILGTPPLDIDWCLPMTSLLESESLPNSLSEEDIIF